MSMRITINQVLEMRSWWILCVVIVVSASLGAVSEIAADSRAFTISPGVIWTALVAVLWGPVAGLLSGGLSNVLLEMFGHYDGAAAWFIPCAIATGLLIGLFGHHMDLRKVHGFLSCLLVTSMANVLLGVPIILFFCTSTVGHDFDFLINGFILAGLDPLCANIVAQLANNLMSLAIAIGISSLVLHALGRRR